MDKRKAANEQSRRRIEDAFFALLEEKKFSEITVSDLVRRSGVARATYYRNFASKEDIIKEYCDRIRRESHMSAGCTEESLIAELSEESLAAQLSFYLKEAHRFLLLHDSGFSSLLLELLNGYAEEIMGDMPCRSPERYRLYIITGALMNAVLQWLQSGAKESPEELAQILLGFIEAYIRQWR